MPIEIAWTVAPMLIVFLLALILTRTEFEVRVNPDTPPPGSKPLYVTVIGHQWWWEYVYDKYDGQDLGIITANELHVPASEDGVPRPVYLTLQVGRCLPQLLGAAPGREDRPDSGPHQSNVVSNEPAGPVPRPVRRVLRHAARQHAAAGERRIARGVPERGWTTRRSRPIDDAAARAGRDVFLSQSCVNCHRVRGTSASGHLRSRPDAPDEPADARLRAWFPTRANELRKWLTDPQQTKSGCLMPAFGLSEPQVDLLVDYLTTLK